MADVRIIVHRYRRDAEIFVRRGRGGGGHVLFSARGVPDVTLMAKAENFAAAGNYTVYVDDSAAALLPCVGCGQCTPVPCPNCIGPDGVSLTSAT